MPVPMLRIKFNGVLRQVADCAETTIGLPASRRLSDALEILERNFPGILGSSAEYQWRYASNQVMVALNGKLIEENWNEVYLSEGDQLILLPPIGGGRRRPTN